MDSDRGERTVWSELGVGVELAERCWGWGGGCFQLVPYIPAAQKASCITGESAVLLDGLCSALG